MLSSKKYIPSKLTFIWFSIVTHALDQLSQISDETEIYKYYLTKSLSIFLDQGLRKTFLNFENVCPKLSSCNYSLRQLWKYCRTQCWRSRIVKWSTNNSITVKTFWVVSLTKTLPEISPLKTLPSEKTAKMKWWKSSRQVSNCRHCSASTC